VDNLELRARIIEARRAQRMLALTDRIERDSMLLAIAEALECESETLIQANEADLMQAREEHLAFPLLKRLVFDKEKITHVCGQLRQVAQLDDPIGTVAERRLLDESLLLERVSVPIGTIGMVFESRPDALVQIVSLCLKSGNAIVLKGGREARTTNRAIVKVMERALSRFSATSAWVVHLEDREEVALMLAMDDVIDLVIPRGSNEFVRYIMDNTHIPVLGHADGLCSLYIDSKADLEKAVVIATDSKCQYPAVCNAVETILVHSAVAAKFLPMLKLSLDRWSVRIHGDERVQRIVACEAAQKADWDTEYLDYQVAIAVVDSLDEAVAHITEHGSGHTDAIVTEDGETARAFLCRVDSADVFWNCSTRFSDGYRFGLGAEVGISTRKIHARGPVGLAGLMTSKWLLAGNGHVVATYSGDSARPFIHESLDTAGPSLCREGSDKHGA